jgi:hypothetical protein
MILCCECNNCGFSFDVERELFTDEVKCPSCNCYDCNVDKEEI